MEFLGTYMYCDSCDPLDYSEIGCVGDCEDADAVAASFENRFIGIPESDLLLTANEFVEYLNRVVGCDPFLFPSFGKYVYQHDVFVEDDRVIIGVIYKEYYHTGKDNDMEFFSKSKFVFKR